MKRKRIQGDMDGGEEGKMGEGRERGSFYIMPLFIIVIASLE